MQNDPHKQGYNNYGNAYVNQYPPVNPSPYGAGGVYPSNNAPPPYPQQTLVALPIRPMWSYLTATPITSSLRTFLIISGIIYLLSGILAFGLEVGIISSSYWRYYTGFWTGGYLLGGGISLLIAASRPSYVMSYLIRMSTVALILSILAVILSIVNVTTASRCDSGYYFLWCDTKLALDLKITVLTLYIITTIHTIVNMIMISNAQKTASSTTTTNVRNGYNFMTS